MRALRLSLDQQRRIRKTIWLDLFFVAIAFTLPIAASHAGPCEDLFGGLSAAIPSIPNRSPVRASVSSADWDRALKTENQATLRIAFPTSIFGRNENIFSDIMARLPDYFSNLSLQTMGRQFHSTLIQLDGLSFEELKGILTLLKGLDRSKLERAGLLGDFQVFDAGKIELLRVGTRSSFLAIKPHREFIEWQTRFYQWLETERPDLIRRHLSHGALAGQGLNPERTHISLLQWGERLGIPLTPEQENQVQVTLQKLIRDQVDRYRSLHNGADPQVIFNLQNSPIELITAPLSIDQPPPEVASLKVSPQGEPSLSKIGRWPIARGGGNADSSEPNPVDTFIEFDIDALLQGNATPYTLAPEGFNPGKLPLTPRSFPPMAQRDFLSLLSPRVKAVYQQALRKLSPTSYPAAVPVNDPTKANQFFVTSVTHPDLAPQKGIPILETLRKLDINSTAHIDIGRSVYASSVRESVRYPGDYDTMFTAIVHPDDQAHTFEQARSRAVQRFLDDVMGKLIEQTRAGKISITELRVGSEYTMYPSGPFKDILAAREANPYLSEQDILNGHFKDSRGKTWTLRELFELGDFIKMKLDLFMGDGTRKEISIQFAIGFEYEGIIHFLQTEEMKGMAPLLRTAVYDGADGFAVSAALLRAFKYHQLQRGNIIPYSLGDLVKAGYQYSGLPQSPLQTTPDVLLFAEPVWSAKFVKKVNNFILLLANGPSGLDEIFFTEASKILQKNNLWNNRNNLKTLSEDIRVAINQPELEVLNALRRTVNDLREYNERHQRFRVDQWLARQDELQKLMSRFEEVSNKRSSLLPQEMQRVLQEFRAILNTIEQAKSSDKAVETLADPKHYSAIKGFEIALLKFEGKIVGSMLTVDDRALIRALISYGPSIWRKYVSDRSQEIENLSGFFSKDFEGFEDIE